MKEILFVIVSHFNLRLIEAVKGFSDMLTAVSSSLARTSLKIIDKSRIEHAESAVDQLETIAELQILSHINEVRNDAIKQGAWNEDHEGRLNILGTILYNEHDWELEQVERYIYEVIETGPAFMVEE